jgi:pyridoxine 4-dehydrogenase
VPLEDSIGALAELKDSGKVRHIGVCNVTEAQLKTRACFRNAMDW